MGILEPIGLVLLGLLLVAGFGFLGGLAFTGVLRRLFGSKAPKRVEVQSIAERVQAVGKLTGLEVCAKEIATAKKGFNWLPPLLLSQARLAMIFHFEKRYMVDLARVGARDVRPLGPGRYELTLPPIETDLKLTDVSPYDIQDGRVLGLLDVIQMNADTQKELMDRAQEEASSLLEAAEARHQHEARQSVRRHVGALLGLFNVEVEIRFRDELPSSALNPSQKPASDAPPLGLRLASAG